MDTVRLDSQTLMMVGFAMALLASAWAKCWGYALLSLAALIEAYVGTRLPFHVIVRDHLLAHPNDQTTKLAFQFRLLHWTAGAACVVILLLTPYFLRATHGRRLMLIGMAGILGMLALELISPHPIDAVIYHPEGPFLRSAIVYFLAAAALAAGALLQRRQSRSEARSEAIAST